MILEGSALWPEFAATLRLDGTAGVWLTAGDEIFRHRIHRESRYHSKSTIERMMIRKFIDRTLAYNKRMIDVVDRHGFLRIDMRQSGVEELADRCLAGLNR